MILVGAQASNGVLIAGAGDTIDEALAEAARAGLSEDFAMLWSAAMAEVSDAASAEADATGERVAAVVANGPPGGTASTGGDGQTAAATDDADGDGDASPSDGLDGEGTDRPGSEEEAGEGGGEGEGEGEGDETRCSICAEPVKAARAEVSLEQCGEVRCKTHTP